MGNSAHGLLMHGSTDGGGEGGEGGNASPEWEAAYETYNEAYAEALALENQFGAKFTQCGHYDYPTYAIVLKEPKYSVEWSGTKTISPQALIGAPGFKQEWVQANEQNETDEATSRCCE